MTVRFQIAAMLAAIVWAGSGFCGAAAATPVLPVSGSPSFRALASESLAAARAILANAPGAASADARTRAAVRQIDMAASDLGGLPSSNATLPNGEAGRLDRALGLLARAHEDLGIDAATHADDATRATLGALLHITYAIGDVAAAMDVRHVSLAADEGGRPRFVANGRAFVPIGVNDLVESYTPYKTFDMFDTRRFDIASIDRDMKTISADGYDSVRIWLKGYDTDDGFTAPGGAGFEPAVWRTYVHNVDATIEAAGRHGLRVVVTGSFPGPNPSAPLLMPKNYEPPASTLPASDAVGGINRLLLIPAMTKALGRFYTDLFHALVAEDPAVGEHLLYVDLYNEIHFDLTQAPFTRTSGSFAYDGEVFNLGDAMSRQALMDSATRAFSSTLGNSVKDVMPDALVTASSGYNATLGRSDFDGGMPSGKHPDGEMLRPFDLLAGGADLIDIHTYTAPARPGTALPPYHERAAAFLASDGVLRVGQTPTATSVSAADAPLVAGEFGAELGKFGVTAAPSSPDYARQYDAGLAAAITEMHDTERTAFCAFDFSGYGIWALGTRDGAADTFNLVSRFDPHERMTHAFSPAFHPDFCGYAVR